MSRTLKYLFLSILLSVVMHLLLLASFDALYSASAKDKNSKKDRDTKLSVAQFNEMLTSTRRDNTDLVDKQQSGIINKILQNAGAEAKTKLNLKVRGLQERVRIKPQNKLIAQTIAPKIIEIKNKEIPLDRRDLSRKVITAEKRNDSSDRILSMLPKGERVVRKELTRSVAMRLKKPSISDLEFEEQVVENDKVGGGLEGIISPFDQRGGAGKIPDVLVVDKSNNSDIDQYIKTKLFIQPSRAGGGFFRLDISLNSNYAIDQLASVPKDVLFLLDSSTSISDKKMRQFISAMRHIFNTDMIHSHDRFNIASFQSKANKSFSTYVSATEDNKEFAYNNLRSVDTDGLTNIYNCLKPFLSEEREKKDRPLLCFILSDGVSTTGDSLKNNILIQKVLKENNSQTAIFSFSIGRGVNRQLLNFLSFQNRGGSMHLDSVEGASAKFVKFFNRYNDIALADLEFKFFDKRVADTVFPKKLSHLFRQDILSLYGVYDSSMEEVVVQLNGDDATEVNREIIFRGKIAEAETVSGLEKLWALNKIYQLRSENIISPSSKRTKYINSLIRQYQLDKDLEPSAQ